MSLKILLADESSTIKKVFQLSLSEYGVEVKTVPSGLDVASVALDFNPDMIFADVLLTKKNGYDVCREVKKIEALKSIPFVLMWSSFMDFNTALANESGANDKLEKPFDADTLKNLAKKYVLKLTPHPLDGLMTKPRLPNFMESETFIRQKSEIDILSNESTKAIALDKLTDNDEFKAVKLNAPPEIKKETDTETTQVIAPQQAESNSERNNIRIETRNFGRFEEVLEISTDDELDDIEAQIGKNINEYLVDTPHSAQSSLSNNYQSTKKNSMSRFDEQLMKEEVRMTTEKICWQIIPDIAERIVREEIQKLLKNIEKSI